MTADSIELGRITRANDNRNTLSPRSRSPGATLDPLAAWACERAGGPATEPDH